ncbi:MAG: filamentous hemagglutinin N-terminal domain-containing protein [Fischerella sp. CENA71]|nr:filamentous hemagglutinin N-terminal domain-containing protein [Fischerella sp. CENA71]
MTQLRHTFVLFTLPVAILETLVFITIAQAQITPDSSLGAESSIVNPDVINGIPSDRIDGGATRGSSLFHSFQEFNVGEGRGAYFSNPANITNILTRVTGGNPSNILGKLGVLGNANLFLLNPKGIFFGRNASLDLNGSFFGTTADSFIFNDNFEFSATNPQAVPLLSVNIPIGLRFRDNPGSIQIQGDGQGLRSYTDEVINTTSGLRVQPNQTLALVGGDVFLEGATLKTAGGRIELGSVAGSGLVSITPINKGFALGYGNVQNFGNIQLSQQASVDASGLGGGDIQVWGRRITLANGSQIEASTLGSQQGGLLLVNATEQLEAVGISFDGRFPSALATQAYPETTGAAGDLIVNTSQLIVRDGAQILTNTLGAGEGGNLTITADKVQLIGTGTSANGEYPSSLRTATEPGATGAAGDLTIKTGELLVQDGAQINASTFGTGKGGNLTITADKVQLIGIATTTNGQISSALTTQAGSEATGTAGDLTINTRELLVQDGAFIDASTFGKGNAGIIKINATGNLTVDGSDSFIASAVAFSSLGGNAGGIEINTNNFSLTNGAKIFADTYGQGNAGIVKINATGNYITADGFGTKISSAVNSTAIGNSGGIEINTNNLSLTNGAEISANTNGQGNAGIVKIKANGDISADGGSEISSTVDSSAIGNSGGIEINTNNLSLTDGAEITASTFGEGNAGIVKIKATGDISADGGSNISSTVGFFVEGNSSGIEINTKNLSLTNGAQINASTRGNGNAGRVIINATGNILASGESNDGFRSGILSQVNQTAQGDAGGIQIITKDLSLTDGAYISASTFGNGNAGIVKINATGNILASGESNDGFPDGIFSQVSQTAQGDAGGIQISTKDLTLSDGAIIDASTFGTGNAGNVIINATGNISASGEDKQGFRSGIFSQVNENAQGNSGGIQITTKDLSLIDGGQIGASTFGDGNAGRVIVNATGKISASGKTNNGNNSGILSQVDSTAQGNSGGIQITTKDLFLTDSGQIDASTFGMGNAGSVIINATNLVSIDGESDILSRVNSSGVGNAGGIQINTKDLFVSNGTQISASTFGIGNAGIVKINATGNISVSGEGKDGFPSGIFSQVNEYAQGDAGGIQINTKDLFVNDGAAISASTFGRGNAGSVIINATGNIFVAGEDKQGSGSGIFSSVTSSGVGNAGGIKINARSLSLSNGAILSANSEGTGAAGNIEVTTAKDIRLDNRALITATTTGDQGNIFLNSRDLILRRNSNITTNATGTATGGNIRIVTGNFVALENSDITANAQKGFGGNIFIKAAYRFSSPDSDITAASDLGTDFSGTVQVNNTDVNPSQGLMQLPDTPTDASNQIAQNPCQKGFGSTFLITGRGGVPSSPNDSFTTDNVRVDLAQPASSSSSQAVTINQPKTSVTTKQIVPARGWIFNEKGEVVLTAYDVNSREFQRQYLHQNSAGCKAF